MPERKKCPMSGRKCYGEQCQLWLEFAVAQPGEPHNAPGMLRGGCALSWTAILQYDTNIKLLGNQAAIESFRNETIKRQDLALHVVGTQRHAIVQD